MTGDQLALMGIIVAVISAFLAYRQVKLAKASYLHGLSNKSEVEPPSLAPRRLRGAEGRAEPGTPTKAFCGWCKKKFLVKMTDGYAGVWRCQRCLKPNEIQMDELGRVTVKTAGSKPRIAYRVYQRNYLFKSLWRTFSSEAWFEDDHGHIAPHSYVHSRGTPVEWREQIQDRIKDEAKERAWLATALDEQRTFEARQKPGGGKPATRAAKQPGMQSPKTRRKRKRR